MKLGLSGAGKAIYFIYSFFCHQLPERSFFFFGEKTMYSLNEIQAVWQDTVNPMILRKFIGNEVMGWKVAWSDRMISFYTSVWFFAVAWWPLRRRVKPLSWWGFALLLLPMIIDGSTHAVSDLVGITFYLLLGMALYLLLRNSLFLFFQYMPRRTIALWGAPMLVWPFKYKDRTGWNRFIPDLPQQWMVSDPEVFNSYLEGNDTFYRWEYLKAWALPVLMWTLFLAALLLVIWGLDWAYDPTPGPALIIGVATIAAPFLILQPGMGAGIAARRTPRPTVSRFRSLVAHLSFGIGLYVAALIVSTVVPSFVTCDSAGHMPMEKASGWQSGDSHSRCATQSGMGCALVPVSQSPSVPVASTERTLPPGN